MTARARSGEAMKLGLATALTESASPMPLLIHRGAYTTARTVQLSKIFELDAHVERLASTAALMWLDQGTHSRRGRGKGKWEMGGEYSSAVQNVNVLCIDLEIRQCIMIAVDFKKTWLNAPLLIALLFPLFPPFPRLTRRPCGGCSAAAIGHKHTARCNESLQVYLYI